MHQHLSIGMERKGTGGGVGGGGCTGRRRGEQQQVCVDGSVRISLPTLNAFHHLHSHHVLR